MTIKIYIELTWKNIAFINLSLGFLIGLTHSILALIFKPDESSMWILLVSVLGATLVAGVGLALYSIIFFPIIKKIWIRKERAEDALKE